MDDFLVEVQPIAGDTSMVLPALTDIVTRVQVAGRFETSVIALLHASVWSHHRRHFAILAGLSGSGKTLLAKAYAEALIQSEQQLLILPVQPGWYDPGALLGYVNPLRGDSYTWTRFLKFLIEASQDPRRPYIAILDEMNLSHPEQYMAPLLSAMETGSTIPLHEEGQEFDGVPGQLRYPSNLVLIGTLNMDETTHGLSDKVLDRAFVHEFWEVDLKTYPNWDQTDGRVRTVLEELSLVLAPARMHFGWRVVDDVIEFMKRSTEGQHLGPQEALDSVVYAKILPKLRGESNVRFREVLTGCQKILRESGLARSQAKVEELLGDLAGTGSARFWR